MTREAAEQFFSFSGRTVDEQRALIAAEARRAPALIEKGRITPSDAKYWAVERLQLCAEQLCCPPPVELVRLIELLLGVAGKERKKGQIKNPAMRIAAIHYVAEHPDAKPGTIARSIGYGKKHRVIQRWLENSEFQELARRQRVANSLQEKTPLG